MSHTVHPPVYGRVVVPAAEASVDARAAFLTRTYLHLLGALLGFVAIEVALFQSGLAYDIARVMLQLPWLAILGAFMVAGWLASRTAHRAESPAAQYGALVGFVVAEALLFVPLLVIAQLQVPGALQSAAQVSLLGFAGLTGIAWFTRRRFTVLGAILPWIGLCAIGAIVAGVVFGFHLGLWFDVGMVVFAGCAILYTTARVLHEYPTDRHVAASLELFSAVALLFWYVLRIFLSRD